MSDDDVEYVYSDDENELDQTSPQPSPVKPSKHQPAGARTESKASDSKNEGINVGAAFPPGQDYRLLHENELRGEQMRVVREVASVLDMPLECANTLLVHFKWNKETMFDKYYADPKGTAKAAGIAHMGTSSAASKPFTCEICLDDREAGEGFGLGCKHIFCRTCWAGYLASAVQDQGQGCVFTKCPADGCGESVTTAVVANMAAPEVAAKWNRFETKHFVTTAKNMALCPGASCSNAFVCRAAVRKARCTCGMAFCFRCSREAHEPVTCDMLELWMEKCGNESETLNWIIANTKKCPKCTVRIEKNQGCNHMKCKNKGCLHEFCWTCLKPWTEHGQSTGGYYHCNKFKNDKEGAATPAAGSDGAAKAELERYLFYYQRYDNHEKAGKFAAKNREVTQKRMAELQSSAGSSWSDVAFLENAADALLECRRVLKYTYVLGYYMPDGKEKELFEHLQEKLEFSTEHLAELTEQPLEKMSRQDMANYTRVTLQFAKHLLEGVEEGLTGGDAAVGSSSNAAAGAGGSAAGGAAASALPKPGGGAAAGSKPGTASSAGATTISGARTPSAGGASVASGLSGVSGSSGIPRGGAGRR